MTTHDVEEAIALGDRVVLLEHGRITMNLAVELHRPRQRRSAAFAALKDHVLKRVMGEADAESPLEPELYLRTDAEDPIHSHAF